MALARHVAPERHQHARPEAELFRSEHRGDDDVAPVAQAAVGPQAHALSQAVGDQHLLRLGKSELPRHPGVLDR